MKVLLINPPYMRLMGSNSVYLPIGLGYLAQYLIKHGISAVIHNGDLSGERGDEDTSSLSYDELLQRHHMYLDALNDPENKVWSEIPEVFARIQPDVVGITVMSAKLHSAIQVARLIKAQDPACKVVLGGPHATIAADELLSFDAVDYVVRGEGERTLLELCQSVSAQTADLAGINGLSFRYEGKAVHNPPRALEKDINEFPFPDRENFLGLELYSKDEISCVVSSRGCPFDCAFCGAKATWTRRVRYRDVDDVIEELLVLKNKYAVPSYYFWDDSFTANRKRTEALLDKIVASKINLPWRCTTRADLLDDALLAKMKAAGCISIDIGLETASDRMLGLIHKNVTMEAFDKAFALLEKHHMSYGVFLMVGLPEETEEDILKTLEYARNSKATSLVMSVFTPYPGTESYDTAKKMGMIETQLDWSRYSHQSPEGYFCKNIPRERFAELVQELAEVVDRHNREMKVPLKSYLRRFWYYSSNPSILVEKIRQRLSA